MQRLWWVWFFGIDITTLKICTLKNFPLYGRLL